MGNYGEKTPSKLDELKALDKKAKRGANVFAYIFGIVGSLVLGFGMCVAMEVIIAEYMIAGIIIGCLGLLMVSVNYSIYNKLLIKGKNKYAGQILELSNSILNN
ncbi:MAG: dihydropteridine reductase [Bacilli bacterium]|nr:dihydropteridine reductase [Bacilli bacterium]